MKLNYEDIDKENIDLANALHTGSQLVNPSVPELNLDEKVKENPITSFFRNYKVPVGLAMTVLVIAVGVGVVSQLSSKMGDMFTTAGGPIEGASSMGSTGTNQISAEDISISDVEWQFTNRDKALVKICEASSFDYNFAENSYKKEADIRENVNSSDGLTPEAVMEENPDSKENGYGNSIVSEIDLNDSMAMQINDTENGTCLKVVDADDAKLKEHTVTGTFKDYLLKDDMIYVVSEATIDSSNIQEMIPRVDDVEPDADKLYIPDVMTKNSVTLVSCFSADAKFELKGCVALYGDCRVCVADSVYLAITDCTYDEAEVVFSEGTLSREEEYTLRTMNAPAGVVKKESVEECYLRYETTMYKVILEDNNMYLNTEQETDGMLDKLKVSGGKPQLNVWANAESVLADIVQYWYEDELIAEKINPVQQ